MELSRSVDRHTIIVIWKYSDHLRFTDGEIIIQKCSSVFVRNFGAMARCGINFSFFCVFWEVLETDFSHVYSGRARKKVNAIYGQKYSSQRSSEGA